MVYAENQSKLAPTEEGEGTGGELSEAISKAILQTTDTTRILDNGSGNLNEEK